MCCVRSVLHGWYARAHAIAAAHAGGVVAYISKRRSIVESIRILIVDDHAWFPWFRSGVNAMLGSKPEFEIVGEAATGRRSDL
jgi:hypothetical protein